VAKNRHGQRFQDTLMPPKFLSLAPKGKGRRGRAQAPRRRAPPEAALELRKSRIANHDHARWGRIVLFWVAAFRHNFNYGANSRGW
jgi:hypothetical protein